MLSTGVIINYIKNTLNLSFKKSWARQYWWDWKKLSFAILLYSVRLSRLLDENTLIVNIDETLLSNEITNSMSWIPKGRNKIQFNVKYEGTASLITAVTSDGNYLATPLICTVDHSIFLEFLKSLEEWKGIHDFIHNRNVVIILDNWSTYRNIKWQQLMQQSDYTYMNIPQYSTILAPIELMFRELKNVIKSEKFVGAMRWNSLEGLELMGFFLSIISKEDIVACFRHSINISTMHLKDFNTTVLPKVDNEWN